MSPEYRYLDFPDLVYQHLRDFKSFLIYDPSSTADRSIGLSANALPVSVDATWIELPSMFSLISASQLQICVVNGNGNLSIQTNIIRRGQQKLVINQGVSYKRLLEMVERDRLERWRNQISKRIVNGYIQ
jgi:hypothetical protein